MFVRVAHSARQIHKQLLFNLFDEIVSEEPLAPQNLFCIFCIPSDSFRGRHPCYFYMIKIVKQYGLSWVCSWYSKVCCPDKQALGRAAGQPGLQALAWAAGLLGPAQACRAGGLSGPAQACRAAGLSGPAGQVDPELALHNLTCLFGISIYKGTAVWSGKDDIKLVRLIHV